MGVQDRRPRQYLKRAQSLAPTNTNHQPTTNLNTMNTYKIIRFRFNASNRTIKKGLTLEQAQAHCQDEKTSGEGWFDGYESE
tara:strand:+ start:546 stop:791 length:246 start_codon:yes stop_codon:yes gene_type:complete